MLFSGLEIALGKTLIELLSGRNFEIEELFIPQVLGRTQEVAKKTILGKMS